MKPKPTAEEAKVNAQFAKSIRELRHFVPSMADLTIAELLAPEQKAIHYLVPKREAMLRSRSNHWTVRLTTKLDRLMFPEITGGKQPTVPNKLARVLYEYHSRLSSDKFSALRNGLLGIRVAEILSEAAWRLDDDFFKEFASSLKPPSPACAIYSWLLRNREKVEACKTVADIWKIPGHPRYQRESFYRLCKSVGLPAL